MKILPLHLSQILRRGSIPFLLLTTVVLFFYLLCLKMGFMGDFGCLLSKGGILLGSRALTFLLRKMGCSGGLTLAIVFTLRALLTPEAAIAPVFNGMVLPELVCCMDDPNAMPNLDLELRLGQPGPEIDLNQPPAPEPAPEQQPGLSREALKEELRKTVKRIRVFQGHLNYWERLLEISLQKERESDEKKRLHLHRMQELVRELWNERRGQ